MDPSRWERINELYHAALACAPEARTPFLDRACADDVELRREVETLLGYDSAAESFMEGGAVEAVARQLNDEELHETQGPMGQQIGTYKILAPLGRGGMGEVYLARDTRLNRKVALKLLPARFTQDEDRVRRFEQEARAASALNHPNIITIHEIGEVANETGTSAVTHYLVTEFIEGETLRQWMARPPARKSLAQVLEVAVQITAALVAAHEVGIVHRDIKPENVMVRRDGYVKVLDFGLAKLTEQPDVRENATALRGGTTASGVVMGTPRYMSPEQARGEKVDARTDIFSLGIMLYEMVTGYPPFAGATPSETIAAILRDEPPPLTTYLHDAPLALERILRQAVHKDRTERYSSVGEMQRDLKKLQEERAFAGKLAQVRGAEETTFPQSQAINAPLAEVTMTAPMQPTRIFGLQNTHRRALGLAVFVIFALLVLTAWFYFKRSPSLSEKDTILLADFENKTGDQVFDGMLRQGLAIQFQQSPFLTLFPEAQMRRELTLMKRTPNEFVTAELARTICERQNLKALITGSIAPLGSHFVLTLEAINGQNGETLAHEQAEAENKEQVLKVLSQLATQIRQRLGESLSSLQRFDRAIYEATTGRLDAFKAYTQATELGVKGRIAECIPFFQRAVELDPEFALAHCQLAIMYTLTDQPTLAAEAVKRAYELRERVTENEKLRIAQVYHRTTLGNLPKAIEVLEIQKATYPRQQDVWNDLAYSYNLLGQFESAIVAAREAIHINPQFAAPYRNLAWTMLSLNRFAEVKELIAQARQRGLDHRNFYADLYQLAYLNKDAAGMQQQVDAVRGKSFEYASFDWQMSSAAATGQWRKASELSRRITQQFAQGRTTEVATHYLTKQSLYGAVIGNCQQAKQDAAHGLQLTRNRMALFHVSLTFALCGDAKQAQVWAEELRKRYLEDTLVNYIWLPLIRAANELQRGNSIQTIEELQATLPYEAAAEFWPQYLRGQAYLKLQQNTEAAAEFQKILDHRGYAPLSPLYPLAQLGLARAKRNRKAYDEFFAWWKEADADLPILLTAHQEAAQLKIMVRR